MVIAVSMCLSLTTCGKTNEAKEAEEAISAIGEVTIMSGDAIANAEKLYGILADSEIATIGNRLELVNARETYDKLKNEVTYKNAKSAYDMLKEVEELCVNGMDDIYGAWYFGIYKMKNASKYNFYGDMAAEVPHFDSTELEASATNLGVSTTTVKSDWQYALWIVEDAMESRGDYNTISANMDEAEKVLQVLTSEYDDYTYYPKLKEYYSSVKSYVDFYLNPTGSFEQLKDTINNYENNIRTLGSDVSFLFTK